MPGTGVILPDIAIQARRTGVVSVLAEKKRYRYEFTVEEGGRPYERATFELVK